MPTRDVGTSTTDQETAPNRRRRKTERDRATRKREGCRGGTFAWDEDERCASELAQDPVNRRKGRPRTARRSSSKGVHESRPSSGREAGGCGKPGKASRSRGVDRRGGRRGRVLTRDLGNKSERGRAACNKPETSSPSQTKHDLELLDVVRDEEGAGEWREGSLATAKMEARVVAFKFDATEVSASKESRAMVEIDQKATAGCSMQSRNSTVAPLSAVTVPRVQGKVEIVVEDADGFDEEFGQERKDASGRILQVSDAYEGASRTLSSPNPHQPDANIKISNTEKWPSPGCYDSRASSVARAVYPVTTYARTTKGVSKASFDRLRHTKPTTPTQREMSTAGRKNPKALNSLWHHTLETLARYIVWGYNLNGNRLLRLKVPRFKHNQSIVQRSWCYHIT